MFVHPPVPAGCSDRAKNGISCGHIVGGFSTGREIEMAKLRHVAMSVPDPDKTADFYCEAFDMKRVGKTDSPLATHQIRASENLSHLYNDLLGAAEGNRKLLVNHTLISDLRPEPKFSERSNDSSHRCFDS